MFERPAPGRYRVGVDYPEPCEERGPVAFSVRAEADGLRREQRGEILPGHRQLIVLEFSLGE